MTKLLPVAQYKCTSDCQCQLWWRYRCTYTLNHGRTITIESFSVRQFWPWTWTQKLLVTFGTVAYWTAVPNFIKKWTCTFREITTSVTNQRTNEPTNKIAWSQYLQTVLTSDSHPFYRKSYLCQSYFCRIAKFGEEFLNHGRVILQVYDF